MVALRYISSNKGVSTLANDSSSEEEPRSTLSGKTPSEIAADWPDELSFEPVSLTQILWGGRNSFNLTEDQMAQYIYNSVMALTKAGAIPVKPCGNPGKDFEPIDRYGKEPGEISANVVEEWRLLGDDHDMERVWFGYNPDDI